ncbi:MAG: YggT family protein [Zoogloeaceae bacterium]|jgi:YggT family protein|nr:YggT family protein [Zoogloeaceae bacterium]
MEPLVTVFLYLLNTAVSFFCVFFLLRFVMQWQRISFGNQLGGFVFKLTDWAVNPLRRGIPGFGGLDWSSLFACFLLLLLYHGLLFAIDRIGFLCVGPCTGTRVLLLLWLTFLAFLHMVVYLCMGVILLDAILSWMNPYSPLAQPLRQLARPLLAPVRRLIPPISGVDLSPLVALVCLQAILIVLPRT